MPQAARGRRARSGGCRRTVSSPLHCPDDGNLRLSQRVVRQETCHAARLRAAPVPELLVDADLHHTGASARVCRNKQLPSGPYIARQLALHTPGDRPRYSASSPGVRTRGRARPYRTTNDGTA